MDSDTSPTDAATTDGTASVDSGTVERPDYFADVRRWLGIVLVVFVWIGYLVPIAYLTVQGLRGQPMFYDSGPWLTVLVYAAGIPLIACLVIAGRNFFKPTDRRRSWHRLGWAALCFALGFGPLMLAASHM